MVQGVRLFYNEKRASPTKAVRGRARIGVRCKHKSTASPRAAPVGRGVFRPCHHRAHGAILAATRAPGGQPPLAAAVAAKRAAILTLVFHLASAAMLMLVLMVMLMAMIGPS